MITIIPCSYMIIIIIVADPVLVVTEKIRFFQRDHNSMFTTPAGWTETTFSLEGDDDDVHN